MRYEGRKMERFWMGGHRVDLQYFSFSVKLNNQQRVSTDFESISGQQWERASPGH